MKAGLLFLLMIVLFGVAYAQPDENYIKKLTGEINQEWLISEGKSVPAATIEWERKKVPGFRLKTELAREQAFLAKNWHFYPVDVQKGVAGSSKIELPHQFEQNRNYNSGWYFSAVTLDKKEGKRYFLILDRTEMFSMLFVNGKRCKHHFGAYTPFEADITDELVQGKNVLSVFVYDQNAVVDNGKLYSQIALARVRTQFNPFNLSGGMHGIPILEVREEKFIKDIFVKTSTRKMELEVEYELSETALVNSSNSVLSFELYTWPGGEKVNLEIPQVETGKNAENKLYSLHQKVNSVRVSWPDPKLWSPEHPNLYVLRSTIKTGTQTDVMETRFGFREFWVHGKSFYLNGIPVRLRGNSIYNPKTPGIDLHRNTFRQQKERFGVNACRIHHWIPSIDVLYAADEVGILIDNQSSIWSEMAPMYRDGGEWFLKNTEIEFEEWVRRDRNCPSVVIWDLENEMLRVSFKEHKPWVEKLPEFVLKLDDTRPLNHSGGGWFSPYQHMVWLHMQEQYCKVIHDWLEKGTNPLVIGEFWVGGRADFSRLPHSPELVEPQQENIERAKIYGEKMLEMRYLGVSGIMPFKLFDVVWLNSPEKSQNYIANSIQAQTAFVWPRQHYTEQGKLLQRELVVCNDAETTSTFKLEWMVNGKNEKSTEITLPPATQRRISIQESIPAGTSVLTVILSNNGKKIATEEFQLVTIQEPVAARKKPVEVYKDQQLADKLIGLGFQATSVDKVPVKGEKVIFIIPENADQRELLQIQSALLAFLESGGNVLNMKQDREPKWFPVKLPFWAAYQAGIHNYELMGWKGLNTNLFYAHEAPVYAQSHPVFKGMGNLPLHIWDNFDGRIADHSLMRPSHLNSYEKGNWRPLTGGSRMEHISLAELFYGKGILMASQLNFQDNLENIQCRALFINTLNYLSERKPVELTGKVILAGNINRDSLVAATGLAIESLSGSADKKANLLIAADGADIRLVRNFAESGGKVLVLSAVLSETISGFKLKKSTLERLAKANDHPMFYGLSSYNFSKSNLSVAGGIFTNISGNAKEILRGFNSEKEHGPVMVSMSFGKGEIILSTLGIPEKPDVKTCEWLSHVLTNAGCLIPVKKKTENPVLVKKTVPLVIDGNLNDWLSDMEDRWVSKYIHASPVMLTSEHIVEGPPEFDLNLSSIGYFLWNENYLYLAGVVFGEERTWESGVTWGSKKEYKMTFRLNDDVFQLNFDGEKATVTVNEKPSDKVVLNVGTVNSAEITDAASLQFRYIYKSGEVKSVDALVGNTFEIAVPWSEIKLKPSEETIKALISVASKGSKLQVPLSANPDSKENWMILNVAGK